MKNIIDYKIEYNASMNDLSCDIKIMIEKGWQPFGPPYYLALERIHCQALVKYEKLSGEIKCRNHDKANPCECMGKYQLLQK